MTEIIGIASTRYWTVSLLQDMNQAGKRTLPGNAPLGFIRRGWRPFEHRRRLEGRLSIIGANAPAPTPRFRVSPRAVTPHRRR